MWVQPKVLVVTAESCVAETITHQDGLDEVLKPVEHDVDLLGAMSAPSTVELRVGGLVDLPHAPLANEGGDIVVAEAGADG